MLSARSYIPTPAQIERRKKLLAPMSGLDSLCGEMGADLFSSLLSNLESTALKDVQNLPNALLANAAQTTLQNPQVQQQIAAQAKAGVASQAGAAAATAIDYVSSHKVLVIGGAVVVAAGITLLFVKAFSKKK